MPHDNDSGDLLQEVLDLTSRITSDEGSLVLLHPDGSIRLSNRGYCLSCGVFGGDGHHPDCKSVEVRRRLVPDLRDATALLVDCANRIFALEAGWLEDLDRRASLGDPAAALPGWNVTPWGWVYVLSVADDGSGVAEYLWVDRKPDLDESGDPGVPIDQWKAGFHGSNKGESFDLPFGISAREAMRMVQQRYIPASADPGQPDRQVGGAT